MGIEARVDGALQELLGRPEGSPALAALRLRATTSAEIRDGTAGEIVLPQTLALETLEPFEGGLFCERTFGPLGRDRETRARALESPFLRARDDDVLAPRSRMETFARISLAAEIEHPLLSCSPWREKLRDAGISKWPLDVIPVLPPDLRALVVLPPGAPGHYAESELNELYRVVIHANTRLVRLRELRAPATIMDVERSRLEEAVAQLVDNARTSEPRVGPGGRPLLGLLPMIAQPSRPVWPTLAELDGMVARGVVRALRAPLAKRSLALISYLRALAITVEIGAPCADQPATVH